MVFRSHFEMFGSRCMTVDCIDMWVDWNPTIFALRDFDKSMFVGRLVFPETVKLILKKWNVSVFWIFQSLENFILKIIFTVFSFTRSWSMRLVTRPCIFIWLWIFRLYFQNTTISFQVFYVVVFYVSPFFNYIISLNIKTFDFFLMTACI